MGAAARTVTPYLPWSSIELLFELLEQPKPILSGAGLTDTVAGDAQPLLAAGLLVPDSSETVASSGDHNDRPLELTWCAETQSFGYFDRARGWVSVTGLDSLDIG